jgi:hypothetical protein
MGITLTRYQARAAEPVAVAPPVAPPQADVLLIGAGTFGTHAATQTAALGALAGSLPAVCTVDNAAGTPGPIELPSGQQVTFPVLPDSHLHLWTEDRRTQLRRHALLAARYEGTADRPGLLEGLTGAGTYGQGGHGGSAQPLLSLIDMDLLIGSLRTHLRRAIQQAFQATKSAKGSLGTLLDHETPKGRAPFVLVLAGGSGSCGAALAQFLGYIVRQETQRVGLTRPTVWLLLAGPRAFHGLTGRTLINYGAPLQALQHLAQHGVDRPGIDGQTLREAAPPYDRVLLIDDAQLPSDGRCVSEGELTAFSWRVATAARALLHPAIRAAYLDHVANADPEAAGAWPGFGTIQNGLGGFEPALLRRQLEGELAQQRAATLARILAADA